MGTPFKVANVEVGTTWYPPLSEREYDPRVKAREFGEDSLRRLYYHGLESVPYWLDKAGDCNRVRYTSPLPENAIQIRERGHYHQNMFARAVLTAEHFPLRLSPDVVWFTIAQGLARHVNENSEKLRSRFVTHEGKEEIEVLVAEGFTDEQWPEVLPVFESEISRRTLNSVSDLIVADFSTSTALSKMCSQVTLMDAMQSYFSYSVLTKCGIPEISLSGTIEDWKAVRQRTSELAKFDLEWWTESLLPILDEFVKAAEGKPNRNFFRRMVNRHVIGRGSGSHVRYSGWFQEFFPYISKDRGGHVRNTYLGNWNSFTSWFRSAKDLSIRQSWIPTGLSSAPFTFDGAPMKIIGGLSCVTQDKESRTVEPKFGMAVVEL